jgi:transcriptional regulator with XRE-family HTH domain
MAKRNKKLTISERFKRSGKTRKAIAEACGVSRPYMSQIALGTRNPGATIVHKLATELGCKPADLRPDIFAEAS